mgnify:FL=1
MIQGGDPKGDGTGGSKETIKGEFSDNGVKNPLSHTRGALSMARSQDNDSASSQFFIVQSDSTYLDGQYAVFGYVYEGMDIVDQICKDVKVEDNNGTVKKKINLLLNRFVVKRYNEKEAQASFFKAFFNNKTVIINADRSATGTAIKIPSKPIIDEKIMIQELK